MLEKIVAEEMRRYGFSTENNLYEVENGVREFQRQVSLAGLAKFLEETDNELHEETKKPASEKDFYFHSYRPAVIWSTFGKVSFRRRYYRYKNAKERDKKGFAYLDQKMGYSAGQVTPSLAELLALEWISTPFEETGARWSRNGAVYTAKARAAWLGEQWYPIVFRRSMSLAV